LVACPLAGGASSWLGWVTARRRGGTCLVLYTPQAGRTLRAGGRAGSPPPPQYTLRRALASPRVGARITRVRFSTKSNYLSHFLSHLARRGGRASVGPSPLHRQDRASSFRRPPWLCTEVRVSQRA
jgi:hypothetical protein